MTTKPPARHMTVMKVAIHDAKTNPVFGESAIYVEVCDEAAGVFIALSQNNVDNTETAYAGKILIDYDTDWPAIVQTVETLIHQPSLKDPPA